MRSIFYLFTVIAALFLSQSKELREAVVLTFQSMTASVKGLSSGSSRAEVRNVEASQFDEVVNSEGRVVVVVFWDEFSIDAKAKTREIERAIRKLPSEVLMCKVATGRNTDLVRRLGVSETTPQVKFYRNGSVTHSFSGEVTSQQVVELASSYVKIERNGGNQGQITPIKKNWTPDGLQGLSADGGVYTPL